MRNKKLVAFLSLLLSVYQVLGFGIDFQTVHTNLPFLYHAGTNLPLPTIYTDDPSINLATAGTIAAERNLLSTASEMYNQALKTDPMQTKVVTGIVLAIVGDAVAQLREPLPYDIKRAYSFAAFDGCYRAVQQITYPPLIALCQGQFLVGFLESLGMTVSPDSVPLAAAMEQTLVSQLVIIPTLYYPVFYAVTGAVQGLTLEQMIDRAKQTFIPLMQRNLLFWIPVQFFVFGFVEESLQISILIVCGLVWTIILSIAAGAANKPQEEDMLIDDSIGAAEGIPLSLEAYSAADIPNAQTKELDRNQAGLDQVKESKK